jgi:hypothetical protein
VEGRSEIFLLCCEGKYRRADGFTLRKQDSIDRILCLSSCPLSHESAIVRTSTKRDARYRRFSFSLLSRAARAYIVEKDPHSLLFY